MSALALEDIQGNILRGYRCANARHLAVTVPDVASGRAFLRELLSEQAPTVTDASDWGDKPDYCLNLGVSWPGLRSLGVEDPDLNAFPDAFRQGAGARASAADPDGIRGVGLGDVGESAPESWTMGGPGTPEVHLMLSLFTDEHRRPRRERLSRTLRAVLERHGLKEAWSADADGLPGGRVHFGYRDGISQPRIEGAPGRQLDDMQPPLPAGDFLLGAGLVNSWGGNHLDGIPAALGDNATYAAFRILEQDCAAFEAMLDGWAKQFSVDPEWLAAKLMGRWRSGASLVTNPDAASPPPAESAINRFDYGPSPEHPLYLEDADGHRCPAGGHVRRLNPRSAPAMGLRGTHRILRRGMPYGPPLDPHHPDDGIERGLIGLFMCADLELQYEFVLRVWANQDIGAPGLRGTREPILGAQPNGSGHFLIPVPDRRQAIVLSGLPTLTRTRGSVYCLMPGLGGLRHLSQAL
jgi:deferrochelatase/peroxidase EfeB